MADYIIYSIIIRTNKTKRNGTNKTERNENDSLRFVRFFVKFFIEKNERNERIGTFANPGGKPSITALKTPVQPTKN